MSSLEGFDLILNTIIVVKLKEAPLEVIMIVLACVMLIDETWGPT
jgi:hypothetical protein